MMNGVLKSKLNFALFLTGCLILWSADTSVAKVSQASRPQCFINTFRSVFSGKPYVNPALDPIFKNGSIRELHLTQDEIEKMLTIRSKMRVYQPNPDVMEKLMPQWTGVAYQRKTGSISNLTEEYLHSHASEILADPDVSDAHKSILMKYITNSPKTTNFGATDFQKIVDLTIGAPSSPLHQLLYGTSEISGEHASGLWNELEKLMLLTGAIHSAYSQAA